MQALKMLTRRRKLPAVCPDTSQVSVWSILRKAIGKDLSKIALPVILNEPLGILQVNFKQNTKISIIFLILKKIKLEII
jgi:hypothetical protein